MMRTRTEITIETERVVVISRRRDTLRLWCGRCEATVSMVSLDEAARIECTTGDAIYEMAEAGRLHFGLAAGQLFICSDSLATRRDEFCLLES